MEGQGFSASLTGRSRGSVPPSQGEAGVQCLPHREKQGFSASLTGRSTNGGAGVQCLPHREEH